MKQHALLLGVVMDQETQGVKTDVQAGRTMIFMCLFIKYIKHFYVSYQNKCDVLCFLCRFCMSMLYPETCTKLCIE